ncbi:cation:proton antiporter [Limisphaera sp. 4302-co]|uniref:cation:proton antiporter domain-containing protein n=1 Tax=Limisphaera sp. 4302-co TaxID=3400417 RepID=UPI003C23C421
MNNIELIICLLLLFMALPDFCSKLGRPALVFPAFIVFGLLLSPFANPQIRTLLEQAGQVGFLLLLFEVGLEIDLPPPREFLRPLLHALGWALVQFPPLVAAALWMGMDTTQALLAATALTACSVGLAHAAWKSYPGLSGDRKVFVLHGMVALEVVAVVFLALGSTILRTGLTWMVLAKMAGIVATVLLLARFALHLNRLFQTVLEHTTHWRIHWLVLLVLVVCALGERLGLDAAKTAFFLGLAMSRVQHHGLTIEECIAPISRRFLIPVFFVALGLNLQWSWLLDRTALWALGTTGALLALRAFLHRHAFRWDGDARVFLLFCPNLTIVALAAKAMLDASGEPRIVAWLLLTGLFMSIASVALLPSGGNNHTVATGQTAPQP